LELSYDHSGGSYLLPTEHDSLKTLVIAGVIGFTPQQLISLLSSASSITELHLSVVTDYLALFIILASFSSPHRLLPKLEVLHCGIQSVMDVDIFLEFLASFVRLRRLTLKYGITEEKRDFRDWVT